MILINIECAEPSAHYGGPISPYNRLPPMSDGQKWKKTSKVIIEWPDGLTFCKRGDPIQNSRKTTIGDIELADLIAAHPNYNFGCRGFPGFMMGGPSEARTA